MKSKTLTIEISRPVEAVFEFATNPANTPKWIDFIEDERTDQWPAEVGTTYVNRRFDGSEGQLRVTAWEPLTKFQLSDLGGVFAVEYSFEAISDGVCMLRYLESVEDGELSVLFGQGQLDRLKAVMESVV